MRHWRVTPAAMEPVGPSNLGLQPKRRLLGSACTCINAECIGPEQPQFRAHSCERPHLSSLLHSRPLQLSIQSSTRRDGRDHARNAAGGGRCPSAAAQPAAAAAPRLQVPGRRAGAGLHVDSAAALLHHLVLPHSPLRAGAPRQGQCARQVRRPRQRADRERLTTPFSRSAMPVLHAYCHEDNSFDRIDFCRLAAAGGLGVDFLLVLSALLACYQLVPALEGSAGSGSKGAPSCWEVVRAYWSRRARRLLPAYGATLALLAAALPEMGGAPVEAAVAHALDFPHCPSALWRSLAFLADLDTPSTCGRLGLGMLGAGGDASAKGSCTADSSSMRHAASSLTSLCPCPLLCSPPAGYHLWSVSLQVQFFLAFPLILCALRPRAPGFRARLAAVLAATVAASTAWRLWSAASVPGGLRLPLGDLSQPEEMAAVRALLQAVYFGEGQVAWLVGGGGRDLTGQAPYLLFTPSLSEWHAPL